jgi:pilus assembly protein CpaC
MPRESSSRRASSSRILGDALVRWPAVAGLLMIGLIAMPVQGRAEDSVAHVTAGQPTMGLGLGEGRLLKFDGPVESVFLADPTIADVRVVAPDVVYVYGKKSGATNLIAWSAEQRVRVSLEFRVAANPASPNDALRKLQPMSTTTISFLGSSAVVSGKARTIEEAIDSQNVGESNTAPGHPTINNTTIEGSQQVNIRVRFAEVARTELQNLGFDWKVFGGAGVSTVGIRGGKVNIEVLFEAMRRQGIVNVLAEPNLTAVSGQTANFLAGGEVPVVVPQQGGVNTVQYKPFGVSLDFTPTIIATDRIALHVRPQVSTIARNSDVRMNNVDLPAFRVSRAETTVEVASGETFAIAGLYQRQLDQDVDKFPLLGEAPVLGALFTSDHFRRNESELVILITPYLVKPTRSRTAATPLDRPQPAAPNAPTPLSARKAGNGPQSSGLIMK